MYVVHFVIRKNNKFFFSPYVLLSSSDKREAPAAEVTMLAQPSDIHWCIACSAQSKRGKKPAAPAQTKHCARVMKRTRQVPLFQAEGRR